MVQAHVLISPGHKQFWDFSHPARLQFESISTNLNSAMWVSVLVPFAQFFLTSHICLLGLEFFSWSPPLSRED